MQKIRELACNFIRFAVEASQILVSIDNIAIQGNLLPTLTWWQAAAAGLEFKKVSKTDGEYSHFIGLRWIDNFKD